MIETSIPLAYTAACACVLFLLFLSVTLAFRHRSRSGDRTGLRTTHPELLDENGFLTKEKLLVVHFSGIDGNSLPLSS